MRMGFRVALLFISFVSSGCEVGVLSKEQIIVMGTASITLLHQTDPPFTIVTERNLIPAQSNLIHELFASGIRGTATPEDLGAPVKAKEKLVDPALRAQQLVAQAMRERLPQAKIVEIVDAQAQTDPAHIRTISTSDFAILLRTRDWGLWPYAFDTSFHLLKYHGEARLIDLQKSKIVWRTSCQYIGDAPKNSRPSIEDFQRENAALLKGELTRASEDCAQQLLEQLFMYM